MARTPRVPGDRAAVQEAAEAAPTADSGLPNAVDIDSRAIRGPVLTRQGWVVPDEAWQKANPEKYQKLIGAED